MSTVGFNHQLFMATALKSLDDVLIDSSAIAYTVLFIFVGLLAIKLMKKSL